MTKQEFYDKLTELKPTFTNNDGLIREIQTFLCPICWLCKKLTGVHYYSYLVCSARKELCLEDDYFEIVDAADSRNTEYVEDRLFLEKFCDA